MKLLRYGPAGQEKPEENWVGTRMGGGAPIAREGSL